MTAKIIRLHKPRYDAIAPEHPSRTRVLIAAAIIIAAFVLPFVVLPYPHQSNYTISQKEN